MMPPVGTPYHRERYNCAHYVADYYRETLGIVAPTASAGSEWERGFMIWMRQHFVPAIAPVDGALVVMLSRAGLHVGVYRDWLVWHCNNGPDSGQVMGSSLSVLRMEYRKIRFYIYDCTN
ncbi:hypothetical protein HDG34_005877 [Paraburkholderia sp. HC6.4b]|uniref:hypothetical protein n=1 Tax=unclassified Paraburkholderia TaxID=2615204 RepID=UPI0016174B50|nr:MULTISPECIES: hypothetical protein [unclassified Paraburkholderia]MBB5411911.1 hypothetical protein [Paraburkholderia sp. HC6.4b]MBB5450223.1 hypothetical protein [Paraburkholderia sp. Kb1A]